MLTDRPKLGICTYLGTTCIKAGDDLHKLTLKEHGFLFSRTRVDVLGMGKTVVNF